MSIDSLADKLVDPFVRGVIDSIRASYDHPVTGDPLPPLTNDEWAKVKPMYVGQMKAIINGSFNMNAAVINQVDELINNKAQNIVTVLSTLIAQVTACMAMGSPTPVPVPPVPGWPPAVTAQTKNANFSALKTELDS